jgi:phosphonate transport system substrate-binding protein
MTLTRRALLRGGALVVLATGLTPAVHAQTSFVVALKPDKNPDLMLQERQALSAYLKEKLGRPVEVIVPLSSAVILEGLAGGSIDLAYLSATDMLGARKAGSAEVLFAGEIGGQTTYRSYWLALKDKPYTKVDDLRGKPIAFASRTSTSGYLIPHADLVKKGLLTVGQPPDAFFGDGNVFYGTGYVSAVERVLSGEAEAAAVSYYVLDEDKHLTVEQRQRLKKVAEQGPVPTHVIAIRKSLAPADRAAVAAALNALNEPSRQQLRDRLFTSKLVKVDETAHLASLTEALRLTGKQ